MGTNALTCHRQKFAASTAVTCLCVFMFMSALAMAQDSAPKPAESPGFFGSIANWFGSTFKDAGKGVVNFGHEAGVAAKSTVDTAKDEIGRASCRERCRS